MNDQYDGVADTGATVSISGNRNLFLSLSPCHIRVECANKEIMVCEERGQLVIVLGRKTVVINNALYIPKSATLISISQLTNDLGMVICFDKEGMTLYPHKKAKSPLFRVRKGPSEKLWKLPLKNFEIEKGKKGFAKAKAFFAKFDKELDQILSTRDTIISLFLTSRPCFHNFQMFKS